MSASGENPGPAGGEHGLRAAAPPSRRWEMSSQEQDMMARFRRDFLDLLDGRVAKVERLVAGQQTEAAHVALLSLESSSAMVGATELAGVVRQLRTALAEGRAAEVDPLLEQVVDQAGRARQRLQTSSG